MDLILATGRRSITRARPQARATERPARGHDGSPGEDLQAAVRHHQPPVEHRLRRDGGAADGLREHDQLRVIARSRCCLRPTLNAAEAAPSMGGRRREAQSFRSTPWARRGRPRCAWPRGRACATRRRSARRTRSAPASRGWRSRRMPAPARCPWSGACRNRRRRPRSARSAQRLPSRRQWRRC